MRMLIVEDERRLARLLKEGFRQENFAVDLCYNSEDGLAAAQADEYDVIILDRMLPEGSDGLQICQTLRQAGNYSPIIMLTAKDGIDQRVEGLSGGADDYLIKPFAFDELLARVRALLRRPHETLGEVLRAGDLLLNTSTKEVSRSGKAILLSPTEYALLEYLLRNKNRVVSKDTLITHVWDFDATVLPSTIEVFVVYLRAKVERPFQAPRLIHTIRGFGYKISDPDQA